MEILIWKKGVIQKVKENRHGIPFGVYTSGLLQNPQNDVTVLISSLTDIGISSLQVTLGGHNPDSYRALSGQDVDANQAFGNVCNFIVLAAESGFPVTVAVQGGKFSNQTVELAKALGAIDTVIY